MTKICLTLGDLVCVVRKRIINASAVKIKIFSQVLHADAGALYMPAGITHAPRRIPFKLLIVELGACKPENKISFIALIFVVFNSVTNAYRKIFLLVSK